MRPVAAVFVACALAGCDRSQERAGEACRAAIVDRLVDPRSTRVENVQVGRSGQDWEVSLDVRANRFGEDVITRATCRLNQEFQVVAIGE